MDDDGPLHFRRVNTRLFVRSSGPRLMHARVLRWEQPTRLSSGVLEWFGKGSALELDPPVPLQVQHYGPVAGRTVEWRSTPLGLDAVLEADPSPTGDGLLDLLDRWRSVPISPAWVGSATLHGRDRGWNRVYLCHLAVCAAGELPWGELRRLR